MTRISRSRRVVVTGCGVVSPVGIGVTAFWDALVAGRSGIRGIESFEVSDLPVTFGGEITGFVPEEYMPRPISRRLSGFARYGLAAAVEAVADASLEIAPDEAYRCAVVVGSGYGAEKMIVETAAVLAERGPRPMPPAYPATSSSDSAAVEISLRFGAQGPVTTLNTACATGNSSVGEAMRMIRDGTADVVIAGSADDCLSRLNLATTARSGALSRRNDDPQGACRPFDRDRAGFVMSNGAGIVVLEELGHALRRGAVPQAELLGYGATSDAHHLTAPRPDGAAAARAIRMALADARMPPEDVGHVNAHGTGTVLNDRIEAAALRATFGTRLKDLPVTATKSVTGHLMGAAGAVEMVATVQTLRTGVIPPTINCDTPDEEDLDIVRFTSREAGVRTVLTDAFGFGGHNAVLLAGAWEGR